MNDKTKVNWREPLPLQCPPSNAEKPVNASVYYRLANSAPATDIDSHRKLYPDKIFKDECDALSLSIFNLKIAL